jgi:cyclopropane fatty-acyl-phospholipid synthase-like methyltransferase
LWTFRRSERDVVNLYNSLSPVMQLATGGNMLNFGYWDGVNDPVAAQRNLCSLVGDIAELSSAKRLVDVGSGLGAPAMHWNGAYSADIFCVNINYTQLLLATELANGHNAILFLNATCNELPLADQSADRIVALESAQHFRPLDQFISESRRVLKNDGLLVMALPVMKQNEHQLKAAAKLGILSFTWSSEHYGLEYVKSTVESGFNIQDLRHIGHQVYEPLADYYVKNRQSLRESVLKEYSPFVERVLYKSLLKMKDASRKGIIDYVIIKAS